jgi:CheY-like chemotaxis protein
MSRVKVTKKVLIVEDDVPICEMLTTALRHGGCDVESAYNRETALKIIEDGWVPDLILLDYHMPGMTAAAFMEQMVNRKPLPRIVLMTADRDADALAKQVGLPEVVEKPFDPFDVL